MGREPERAGGHRFVIRQCRRANDNVTTRAVLMQFEKTTPKAFANFSPGLERSDNPGIRLKTTFNPVRVRRERNPYRVSRFLINQSQGSRCAPTLG